MLFFNSILLPFDHERLFLYQTVSGKKNCVRIPKKSTEFEVNDCGFLNEKNAQSIFKQLSKNQYFHLFQQQYNIPVNGFGDYPQLSDKTSWKLYIDLDDCTEQNQSITGYISTCLKILQTHFSSITLDFHFYVSHPKHWEYISDYYDGMDQWAHCTDEMYCYFKGETLVSMPDVLYQKLLDLNFRLILEMDSKQQTSIYKYANQPFHLHSIRYAFQVGTERDIVTIVNTHMEQFESTNIGIFPISCRFGQNPFSVDIDWIDKFDTEEFCNQFVSAIQSCTDIQRFEYAMELKLRMNGIGPLPGFGIPAYARVSSKTLFTLTDRINNPIDLLSTLDHYNHPSTNSNCVQCPIQHICGGFRPFDFTVEHDQAKMEALFTIYCTMQKRLIHRFIQKLYDPLLSQSNQNDLLMTSHMQPKRILIIAPLFGGNVAIHSALGFLLPALQSNHFEIHLITNSLKNTYYRWKGVYVYSIDHPSIAVIKTLQFFSSGLYLNLDDGLFQNEFQIKNWIIIDQTEIQLLLDAIEKHEFNQISSSIQALINIIKDQFSIIDFDIDSTYDKSNDGFNLIAPFFETSEEGGFSRGILQYSIPDQININPVCIPSFFNIEVNINTNLFSSIRNTLIIIPTYYSHDEVTQLLSMYNNTASDTYIIYPAIQHIQIILDHSATIILSSNYLKQKVLKIYGDQYNEKIVVLHKSIAVPTNDGDKKKEEVTRFITIISNHSEVNHLDYVCTSFIDLLKDSENFELHICFLSNANQSETYHYYNNLFASKQRLICHYCEMNYAEQLLQSSDCYISINNTGCFDIYALKAAVHEVPVMAAQHETTFEYFNHHDILTYEFESESAHIEQNNNLTKLKHTVRKESIATELNRFIQHKELIQTKMKSVKRYILSKHNMDAWLLAFEYHIKNKSRI